MEMFDNDFGDWLYKSFGSGCKITQREKQLVHAQAILELMKETGLDAEQVQKKYKITVKADGWEATKHV